MKLRRVIKSFLSLYKKYKKQIDRTISPKTILFYEVQG